MKDSTRSCVSVELACVGTVPFATCVAFGFKIQILLPITYYAYSSKYSTALYSSRVVSPTTVGIIHCLNHDNCSITVRVDTMFKGGQERLPVRSTLYLPQDQTACTWECILNKITISRQDI
jgi:hypothetical protein